MKQRLWFVNLTNNVPSSVFHYWLTGFSPSAATHIAWWESNQDDAQYLGLYHQFLSTHYDHYLSEGRVGKIQEFTVTLKLECPFSPFTFETGRGYLLGWAFFSGRISMRLSWSPRIIQHIHVCKQEWSTSECRRELCSSWNNTGFSLLFHILRANVERNLFSRVFEIKGFLLSIKEGKNVLA